MPRNLADQNDQSISQDWADRDKLRGLETTPSLLAALNAYILSAVVLSEWSLEETSKKYKFRLGHVTKFIKIW